MSRLDDITNTAYATTRSLIKRTQNVLSALSNKILNLGALQSNGLDNVKEDKNDEAAENEPPTSPPIIFSDNLSSTKLNEDIKDILAINAKPSPGQTQLNLDESGIKKPKTDTENQPNKPQLK